MNKRAVIVVDLQKDYLADGKFPVVGIDAAVANAVRVLEAARTRDDMIVHIRHESADPADFFAVGTVGADIIPAVTPVGGERVITKNYPNSFRETALKDVLDAQAITEVVIIGAMSHMCIDATSRAAVDFGFDTTIVEDACATRDVDFNDKVVPAQQVHTAFMSALAFAYGKVVSTDEQISGTSA